MAKVKSQILSKVVTLLVKFSNRLVRISAQTRENTDNITALQDLVRLKVGKLEGILVDVSGKADRAHAALIHHGELFDKLEAKVDDREKRQVMRDQSNVQSLVNLRDSTATAFNQVKADVESLLRTIQRLNERVGQAESQSALGSAAWHQTVGIENRVGKIEGALSNPAPAPSMPSDHVWLNKKLTGVYDTTADLEVRMRKLETRLVLYENLRKAQNAFAETSGAFLAGPKV